MNPDVWQIGVPVIITLTKMDPATELIEVAENVKYDEVVVFVNVIYDSSGAGAGGDPLISSAY